MDQETYAGDDKQEYSTQLIDLEGKRNFQQAYLYKIKVMNDRVHYHACIARNLFAGKFVEA